MKSLDKFYINGQWVEPTQASFIDVIDPSTEAPCARVALGNSLDVDAAVKAAKQAFETYSLSSREFRIELLERIVGIYKRRIGDMAEAIRLEMGAPTSLAAGSQAHSGLGHLSTALEVLKSYQFEETIPSSLVVKEPIGVCGLITPWNWPVNQIACKVGPALAVGCTMVLKPSEVAPLSGQIFAEILDEAGVPAGVFNLVNGDGPGVGAPLSAHPGVDMMSFTGSTRAGVLVAEAAAKTVKRVAQELGGKSPNIVLPKADISLAVKHSLADMMQNSGQSCNAPSRMLVHVNTLSQFEEEIVRQVDALVVGSPSDSATDLGPVVSKIQFDKIQGLIQSGIDEGAKLLTGGTGRPEGLTRGYYVRPTVFSCVNNEMTIAREEIFGPVMVLIPYTHIDEAVAIANDTEYGLAAYIQGQDMSEIASIARRLRAGNININGNSGGLDTPFGGYKQSGNGREWGAHGFDDYLEIKAISGLEV